MTLTEHMVDDATTPGKETPVQRAAVSWDEAREHLLMLPMLVKRELKAERITKYTADMMLQGWAEFHLARKHLSQAIQNERDLTTLLDAIVPDVAWWERRLFDGSDLEYAFIPDHLKRNARQQAEKDRRDVLVRMQANLARLRRAGGEG